jgi:RHS repeat-associated protein
MVTWLVVGAQILAPFSDAIVATAAEALATRVQPEARDGAPARPEPVLTPQQVAVNRTVPIVQPPASTPSFSENPSDEEFFRARVFAEPLIPTGKTTVEENRALAGALQAYLRRKSNDDVSAITQFLEQFPNSTWRVSLLTDLGIVFRKTGYFSRAMQAWEEAWRTGKAETQPNPRAIVDRAVAELAELNARVGRFERLEGLFSEIEGREVRGPATEKIAGAKQGLWLMRNNPEKAFRCGPMALDRIRASLNPVHAFDPKIIDSESSLQGMSLVKVNALAKDLRMEYQMARRTPGAKIITPAVVHWKVGHFAALVRGGNGRYLVQDPTFTDDLWVTRAALDDEASGYFLVPAGPLPEGWQAVDEEEGKTIFGKGNTNASDPDRTKKCDKKVPNCGGQGTPMAQYAVHTMLVSLNIVDTPVGYAPPRGEPVRFEVTYNQREANQPSIFTYANLGPKWTFDWLAYITDDPNIPSADASYFTTGGGTERFSGYNSGTSTYANEKESHASLVRTSSTSYERRLPDGSKQIFNLPDGASAFPRKIFLTQEVDPAGNTTTYTYDGSFRLTAVTDSIGQVTTLSYALPGDSLKITKVTDPFGRFATFDYQQIGGVWQLVKITDVIGITSEFTYSGDFINSLRTPYGTSTFAKGESGTARWLEAIDPLGQKERVEYRDEAPGIPSSESVVPGGITTANIFMNYRNSFYWDKKAMIEAPGDYTKAHIFHFQHTVDINKTSGILESDKAPLEKRVWRNYEGVPNIINGDAVEGTNGSPIRISRVLDDNSTQLHQFQYNVNGKVTQYTDPVGRVTINLYAANGIDLTEVRQLVAGSQLTVARLTYNSQHLPLTAVDAASQTNRFVYNAQGQLTAVTNALSQVVTIGYSSNSYLTNITGPMAGAITGLTYDGYGRIRTVTDSEGYTVTMDYDALDRPTKITYPDGAFEQIVYRLLDPILRKDRRGHWSSTSYDALRRVTDIQDSLNRVTHLEWCNCGSLESLTDPMGKVTTWMRDLQGRPTSKIYPDTTSIGYSYGTATSRLQSMTDAKNQTTRYSYFADDNLKQITYSNAVVATPSVTFTYDTNFDRMLTMVDGIGTNTYSYYPVTNSPGSGRLQSIDGPLANDTVTYQYDPLGRLTNRAIDSVAQSITYDVLGRVTVLTNALGGFTNTYVNTTFRLSSVDYPNGQKTVFNYLANTNDQRLEEIKHLTSASNIISKFNYTYDPDGQIKTWTQQADTGTPKVHVFEYDPTDQLVGATVRSNGITGAILKQFIYGYDKSGNRTSEQIDLGLAKASYNNANQQTNTVGGGPVRFSGRLDEAGIVQASGNAATMGIQNTSFVAYADTTLGTNLIAITATDYSNNSRTNTYQIVVTNNSVARALSYDANGDLVSAITATSTNTYEWDAADRLVKITQRSPQNTAQLISEFTYDGLGRSSRIVEKTNGVVQSDKRFLWCSIELCEERDSAGGTVTRRFFGQGEQISGANYFFTRDHLGSVREMTDGAGTIRARYEYDSYGRRTKLLGDLDVDFAFTGHYYHQPSGLHLAPFRAYDADSGRWISRDPIAESGGLNLYTYVSNNPINRADLMGLVDCNALKHQIDDQYRRLNYDSELLKSVLNDQMSALTSLFVVDRATDTALAIAGNYAAKGLNAIRLALTSRGFAAGERLIVDLARSGALTGPGVSVTSKFSTLGLGGVAGSFATSTLGKQLLNRLKPLERFSTEAVRKQFQNSVEILKNIVDQDYRNLQSLIEAYRQGGCK